MNATVGALGRFADVSTTPTLADVVAAMDEWYAPAWAQSWDAVGLVCGDRNEPVRRIQLALDPVPATVDEAIDGGAQLLITHHPLLLTGVHGVPADDPKGALVHRLIRNGVGLFVAHTNADVADPGVSDALADLLGVTGTRPLDPDADDPRRGIGRIGRLAAPTTLAGFTELVAQRLPATVWGVRAAGVPDRQIEKVAVAGGSGSSEIALARALGADVLVTADVKHHHGVEAVTELGPHAMAVVDAAHWATEAPWLDVLAGRLRERFGTTVDVSVSQLVTDPWTVHANPPARTSH